MKMKPAPDLAVGFALGNFCNQLVGCHLSAIAFDCADRIVVTVLGIGHAGVSDLRDEVAKIAGVTDRAFRALIRENTTDHQLFGAKIAQHVVDMGRYKDR